MAASASGTGVSHFALAVLKLPVSEATAVVAAHAKSVKMSPAERVYLVVVNGGEACTVTGAPSALAAFHAYIQQWATTTSTVPPRGAMKLYMLPVRAPFHCAEWLGAASKECAALLTAPNTAASAAISTDALERPLWSCVDGRLFSPHAAASAAAMTRLWMVAVAVATVNHRSRTGTHICSASLLKRLQ